jgi:hypothetical protein
LAAVAAVDEAADEAAVEAAAVANADSGLLFLAALTGFGPRRLADLLFCLEEFDEHCWNREKI